LEDRKIGIAEWCYEAIAKRLEGSFRPSRNHIVIQQRRKIIVISFNANKAIARNKND